MKHIDLVIIGGGPAGLAAAVAAKKAGIHSLCILERDTMLGGILNQCIHNGFGLHTFQEELTGPEYAARFIAQVHAQAIPYQLDTMVLSISPDKCITATNQTQGLFQIQAGAIILAMGCRERSRGALNLPGYRPAGIFSAGTAQRFVNMEGRLPGRDVVILGSGDIGLIMARRMHLEGARVHVVAELMPYSGGLKRNIVQCLDDFNIPLKLSHTVTQIHGKDRVTAVTLAQVDAQRQVIPGTDITYPCDTLLLSVGLIPENELSMGAGVVINPIHAGPVVKQTLETSVEGIFACGNVLHVHDLVDFVSQEAQEAGRNAAAYLTKPRPIATHTMALTCGQGVRYCVPATICPEPDCPGVLVRFRVDGVYRNCRLVIYFDQHQIESRRRMLLSPGEMEEVHLPPEAFANHPDCTAITIAIEEGWA